jgi:hypothetical protein
MGLDGEPEHGNHHAHGTVTATSFLRNGAVVYTVTGMDDDAAIIQMHAETTGDAQATYAYVMESLSASDIIM